MDHTKLTIIRDVLIELEQVTKCPEQPSKAYVLPRDAQRLWADKSRISRLLDLEYASPFVKFIHDKMTRILTILVYSNATLCLQNFTSHFFGRDGQPRLKDKNLPLDPHQIDFFEAEPALKNLFLNNQFLFCPWRVEVSDKEVTTIPPVYRLPFETDPQAIGSGFYGEVAIVAISPLFLRYRNGSVNPKAQLVAIKSIKLDESFEKEAKNLRILKQSLRRPVGGVIEHYAIIKHGTNSFVVMPYAKLGDLWQFLQGGKNLGRFTILFPSHHHCLEASRLRTIHVEELLTSA